VAIFKTIEDFNNFELNKDNVTAEILVGMGTCGIAAGADKVYKRLLKTVEKRGLDSIKVKKTGCLGLCFSEPNVEVRVDGLPDVLYGYVTDEFADRILDEHVIDQNIINKNVIDKPIIDIYK